MPHIDAIVRYVADIISERSPDRPMDDCVADARVAVAAVRRFDLQHSYEPLNARAWSPQNGMVRNWLGYEEKPEPGVRA